LITALAPLPVSIGLGAGIPIDDTDPFDLARAFAAIDRQTRGRSAMVVDLAAQVGHNAPPAERYARAVEFFEVTTKLWDSCDGSPLVIMPVASPMSRHLAAQVADVALITCLTLDAAECACVAIREKAAAHGRRLQAIRILVDLVPILGRTEAEARQKADALGEGDQRTLRFVGTPPQLAVLMRSWHAVGACDGFNLLPLDASGEFDLLATCVAALARRPVMDGATLRARLQLPRPLSRYAA